MAAWFGFVRYQRANPIGSAIGRAVAIKIMRADQFATANEKADFRVELSWANSSYGERVKLPMPIPTSYGEIRRWSSHDPDALVKYANNRKVWLNLRDAFPHPYTAASAQAFLEMVGRQGATGIPGSSVPNRSTRIRRGRKRL